MVVVKFRFSEVVVVGKAIVGSVILLLIVVVGIVRTEIEIFVLLVFVDERSLLDEVEGVWVMIEVRVEKLVFVVVAVIDAAKVLIDEIIFVLEVIVVDIMCQQNTLSIRYLLE